MSPPGRRLCFILAAVGLAAASAVGLAALGVVLDLLPMEDYHKHVNQQWLQQSKDKERRVLAIGDSFLLHWHLRRCLRKDLYRYFRGRDIGLLVSGEGGMGPFQYKEQVDTLVPELNPQLTLLFYHVGNDLTDIIREENSPRYQGALRRAGPPRPAPPRVHAAEPLRQSLLPLGLGLSWGPGPGGAPPVPPGSHWAHMIQAGLDPGVVREAYLTEKEGRPPGDDSVNGYLLITGMDHPAFHLENVLLSSARARTAWRLSRQSLVELFQKARDHGSELALVAIPSVVQVSKAQFPFLKKIKYQLSDELVRSRQPQDLLARLCREQGVTFLDLLPHFKAHPRRERLYWRQDDHFSQLGHEVAFELVERRILDPWTDR